MAHDAKFQHERGSCPSHQVLYKISTSAVLLNKQMGVFFRTAPMVPPFTCAIQQLSGEHLV